MVNILLYTCRYKYLKHTKVPQQTIHRKGKYASLITNWLLFIASLFGLYRPNKNIIFQKGELLKDVEAWGCEIEEKID
jgi:hypothetical protein